MSVRLDQLPEDDGEGREATMIEAMREGEFEGAMARIMDATGTRTQVELAKLLGIRQSSISDAKRRASIPDPWLVKLLITYDLSPDWILRGAGDAYLKGDPDRAAPAGVYGPVAAAVAPAAAPEPEPTVSELKAALEARLGTDLEVFIVTAGRRVSVEPEVQAGPAGGLAMLLGATAARHESGAEA